MDLFCRDDILAEEARAVICFINALKTQDCLRSLAFGPYADGLDELPEFDEVRLKDALEYICDHTDALARVIQCIQWHKPDAVEGRCEQRLIEDLSGDGKSEVCDGVELFLNSCMTIEVWPQCYTADLDVLANVIDKLVPTEDCVVVGGAGQATGNVAFVAILLATVFVYTGLIQ